MATVPAPPPLEIIEATFGPFVTGIMMQQLLMGVVVVQVYDYYRVFTKDSTFYKSLVALMLAVTILQASMDFATLYRCTVTFYGNFDKFDDTDWSLWWEIAVTALIGSIAQSFFLERCWSATKSYIVLALGAAGILTSLGAGIASTIKFQMIKRLSLVPNIPEPILVFLIGTAVVDLYIAVVLVWSITRVKSRFRKTETLIARIIRLTFQTSALTATIAVLNVVLVLSRSSRRSLPSSPTDDHGYVISVMVTLSARTGMREIMEQNAGTTYQATRPDNQATSSDRAGSKLNYGTAGRVLPTQSATASNLGGIQISTTTYIRDDNDNAVDVDHDSTRKVRTNSDIELGPVSAGKELDVHIPIQYPDGRVARARGKDDSGSTSDEDDWKGGRGV
ncbi:hypothetical protein FRC01_002881 [Tulasnella sp. 417]|nr:hypothetical protein FRC01_002881 [Tulasnella sp. 417]